MSLGPLYSAGFSAGLKFSQEQSAPEIERLRATLKLIAERSEASFGPLHLGGLAAAALGFNAETIIRKEK